MVDTMQFVENKKPMIICFHVTYSGSFHLMQPIINDLKDDYEEVVDVVLIVKGKDLSLESQYEINSFPTLLLIWNDDIVVRLHGLVSREELYGHVNDLLKEINEFKKIR